MNGFKKAALALSLAAVFTCVPAQEKKPEEPKLAPAIQKHIDRIIERLNQYRTQKGLPTLKVSPELTKAAMWMAADLSKQPELSHLDSKKRLCAERLVDFGYIDYIAVAENLAAGQVDGDEVFEGWQQSPHHDENMLNNLVREVGVGYAFNAKSKYLKYWVLNLGDRRRPKDKAD